MWAHDYQAPKWHQPIAAGAWSCQILALAIKGCKLLYNYHPAEHFSVTITCTLDSKNKYLSSPSQHWDDDNLSLPDLIQTTILIYNILVLLGADNSNYCLHLITSHKFGLNTNSDNKHSLNDLIRCLMSLYPLQEHVHREAGWINRCHILIVILRFQRWLTKGAQHTAVCLRGYEPSGRFLSFGQL